MTPNSYRNVQASLLRWLSEQAALHGGTAVNMEAAEELDDWPDLDMFALDSLTVQTEGRDEPLEVCSAVMMVATEDDPNNMRLSERISDVYDALKPGQSLPLYDALTGLRIGELYCVNKARVMPVVRTGGRKRLQGVQFSAGVAVTQ